MQIKGAAARWHTLPELLADKARRHGDKPFIEIDGRSVSYCELAELSDRYAAGLARQGVAAGDRVASLMFNCAEQVILWFAVNKLGAIWTPLNGGLVGRDLSYTLGDCGARILFVDAETHGKLADLPVEVIAPVTVFAVGGDAGDYPSCDTLLDASEPPAREVLPQHAAMILYTGGTTGMPKGVLLSHFSFICAGYRYAETYEVGPHDRHFTTLPLFHAAAVQLAVTGPLLNDMTSVIDYRFSASTYWQRVRETGATVIDPIGTMATVLCQQPESADDRSHNVRVAVGITGQIPETIPATFKSRFGIPLVDIYGLTEAGGAMITSNRLHDYAEGAVGKTYGWAELRIFDRNDEPVPAGEVGEIVLRPTVPFMFMLGYHNNPERTLECFRNLWFHTDDLGYLDESGNLFFVGREVHWLRRRGENISAYEIESILSGFPGVSEVIVVGVPAELGEEDVKAYVVPQPGTALEPEALIEYAQQQMASFKVPRYIAFVEDFPRSATKREVERAKVKAWTNEGAWDREREMGRLSSQGGRRK